MTDDDLAQLEESVDPPRSRRCRFARPERRPWRATVRAQPRGQPKPPERPEPRRPIDPSAQPARAPGLTATERDPRRLVIADDSAEMRQLVRAAVGTQFDDVIEVGNGRDLFWTLLRARFLAGDGAAPDLVVITDLAMPAYNGLDVLAAWQDAAAAVPTIVITAYPSDAVRARASELGVALLAKPFSLARLRALVHDVFRTPDVTPVAT